MEERVLGRSGLKVPVLGWGTVKIGRNTAVKYPDSFELPTDPEVDRLVATAIELGIRLFDTAPAYGSSEERLGRALAGRRDQVILSTKVGEEFDGERSSHAFDGASIRHSVQRSLRRLRTEYVDLLLLHSDGRDEEILESSDAMAALVDLKRRGLARAIGMSAKTAAGVLAASRNVDVVMAPLSEDQCELANSLERASEAGCGVLAIKVLGQGHSVGKRADLSRSLGFVLGRSWVSSVIAGSRNPEHLRQWVQALPDRDAPPTASTT